MSDSSKRRLKCSSCGARKAQIYGVSIGRYFIIHCPSCNRQIQSKACYDLDMKNIKKVKAELIESWHQIKVCRHPEHKPPSHIVLEPGCYEHECPWCGLKQIINVPMRPMLWEA